MVTTAKFKMDHNSTETSAVRSINLKILRQISNILMKGYRFYIIDRTCILIFYTYTNLVPLCSITTVIDDTKQFYKLLYLISLIVSIPDIILTLPLINA